MVRGRPKSFDTDEVLDRAMEVFRARGYEATCMPTLLEHMGIGRQSLYDTFGDKEHLFKAALKRYLDKFYLKLMEILDRPGSKLDNIENLLRYMSPNYDQGKTSCLAVNASAEFGSEDPEIADFLKRHYDRMAIALENALESARQAGELRGREQASDAGSEAEKDVGRPRQQPDAQAAEPRGFGVAASRVEGLAVSRLLEDELADNKE